MEQLETIKQRSSESIKDFYLRLDDITNKCLILATESQTTSHTYASEIWVIQRIALRRFTHHCIPEISQILRHTNFISINEAMSLACEDEKKKHTYNRIANKKNEYKPIVNIVTTLKQKLIILKIIGEIIIVNTIIILVIMIQVPQIGSLRNSVIFVERKGTQRMNALKRKEQAKIYLALV